jgi:D-alanyl-D-alanine carboxypeptidase/D-alanyl-D-alanine-endopeptidase (penicillin-binding protein 4)
VYGDDWPVEQYSTRRRRRVGIGRSLVIVAVAAGLALAGGYGTGSAVVPGVDSQWVAGQGGLRAAPVLGPLNASAPQPTAAGVSAKLQSLLGDPALGSLTMSVLDASTGTSLLERDPTTQVSPASTEKLVTAAAVLGALGPTYQIPTRVVAGANPGEVVLVGGGDPSLAAGPVTGYPGAGRLDLLAQQVLKAMNGVAPTHVVIDTSLFSGRSFAQSWAPGDQSLGYIAPITALMMDGARVNPAGNPEESQRVGDPARAAGDAFAKALGLPASAVSDGVAPPGATQLGQVLSPPLSSLVEGMLQVSDNVVAEMLARQVAIARHLPASFEGAAEATSAELNQLGIPSDGVSLFDGSGLSIQDKVTAQVLAAVLTKAAGPDGGKLRAVLSGLPVADWSGTLATRYLPGSSTNAAAGIVRAKTGTLNGVDSLAGEVVDADGRLLTFAMVANSTRDRYAAEGALDRIAAALATCGC